MPGILWKPNLPISRSIDAANSWKAVMVRFMSHGYFERIKCEIWFFISSKWISFYAVLKINDFKNVWMFFYNSTHHVRSSNLINKKWIGYYAILKYCILKLNVGAGSTFIEWLPLPILSYVVDHMFAFQIGGHKGHFKWPKLVGQK